MRRAHSTRNGFTLAEVVVTIAIVGIALAAVFQSLNSSKLSSAHTTNMRIARDLALLVLARIETGYYCEEIDSLRVISFAEEGYEYHVGELALGEETFVEVDENEMPFNNFEYRRIQQEDQLGYDDNDEEDEEIEEPYEKVRVRVTFPEMRQFETEIVLERWIPWDLVYCTEEEEGLDGDEGLGEDPGGDPLEEE